MRRILTALICGAFLSAAGFAQQDTVYVPDTYDLGGVEGTLNDSIAAYIAMGPGALSNVVFKLKPYGYYVLTGGVITPPGEKLEIVADPPGSTQQTSPPMILWTASAAPDKRYNFDVAGAVKMKNVWLLYADNTGNRPGSTLRIGDSSSVSGGVAEFENVIFDYSNISQNGGGAIEMFATSFKGVFKNCYFRNCGDDHFRYYSRALGTRYQATGLHADSVYFENCTFANMGYVYMQEGTEHVDDIYFNHCTFYNVVMFTLESGAWWKMNVTNSIFANTFMFGRSPVNDGEGFGGTINIAPVDSLTFPVPFTDQDRRILFANNNYYLDQWLVDWMGWGPNGNPFSKFLHANRRDDEIPQPMPLMNSDTRRFFDSTLVGGGKAFPTINMANIDSINVGFVNPPLNLDSLKSFLHRKWDDNSDVNWMWKPENGYNQVWPLEEDMSYSDATIMAAGMGGFPLGDLYRWWPSQYAAWAAQADAERTTILTWRETGSPTGTLVERVPGIAVPENYALGQNYPNPFNPTTRIEYSIPVAGPVLLKVYNTLGQEVATIVDAEQTAGSYVATLNANGLTSGIYFYRLESGTTTLTKNLSLIK